MNNEAFFKMPKVLFSEQFKNLSAEAKLLYGLMLDRTQLSAANNWCDKNGEVFIFFTIAETSKTLGCGHDKATRLQRELVKHNLLGRKYQGKVNYVKDTRGTCPTHHYIRADALEQIVLLELKKMASLLKKDEELFTEILEKKTDKDLYDEKRFLEGELQKSIARQQTVASLYEKLYKDNATGKVTDEWFTHMAHKYEVERATLNAKIFELREKIANLNTIQHSKEMFLGSIRKFLEMEMLTTPLIHELIDHIDVYETEGAGKNKTQRVVIHYRFVGVLEIAKDDEPCLKEDTRQGVAVSYISKALPESA